MKKYTMLEILSDQRIHNALESSLKNNKKYYKSRLDARKKLDYAFSLNMNKKQKTAVDRAISAHIDNGADYGRAAYYQGLQDGITLIMEILNIAHSNIDE